MLDVVKKTGTKPVIVYDATNEEHRRYFSEYVTSGSWGKCPVNFKAPHYGNTLGYIQRVTLEYYTKQEFDV